MEEMIISKDDNEADIRDHVGMVAIVGRANVGKSSLLNAMIDEKVSIVSKVCQTTRNLIRVIHTEPRGQIVFLDTPGLHKAQSELGKLMNRTARAAPEGTDLMLLVFDAGSQPREEDRGWMTHSAKTQQQVVVAFNKIDQPRDYSPAYVKLWHETVAQSSFPESLRVSALSGDGVTALRERLLSSLPRGPLLFPEEVLSDYPRKLAAADVIREKYFLRLQEELPHAIAVEVDEIMETEDCIKVNANIFVDRESQKGIVIGHKGRLLRYVKRSSIKELSSIWERPVTLEIRIKTEKNWRRNYWLLKRLGYIS